MEESRIEPLERWSLGRLARLAGGLYLVNIVGGAFALGYVPAAAPSIAANEVLFRLGIAAHVIIRSPTCR